MASIFVDTWAWYALADADDRDYDIAQITQAKLLDEGFTFITTNFVVSETITLMRYNLGHAPAIRFWQILQRLVASKILTLVRVTAEHELDAWNIFARYSDQKFSFVDCTSFAVMRAMKINQVFTADHHFAILGFELLPR